MRMIRAKWAQWSLKKTRLSGDCGTLVLPLSLLLMLLPTPLAAAAAVDDGDDDIAAPPELACDDASSWLRCALPSIAL